MEVVACAASIDGSIQNALLVRLRVCRYSVGIAWPDKYQSDEALETGEACADFPVTPDWGSQFENLLGGRSGRKLLQGGDILELRANFLRFKTVVNDISWCLGFRGLTRRP
ncbi:unnamed protein product [Mesocestoides corti]|uniref:Uncharacterized protein n=1 Tax=Mesocestoides corti TaxID=53468 RepID=A0A3P6G883_MESCO|nr:unnamed protein product [Mesocestoides corti]